MLGKNRGFTLIELLIVVAIIAILAAIAVPNFLEAQVRAKIARVKADSRSLATAVESYAVDNNRPPLSWCWRRSVEYYRSHGNYGNYDWSRYVTLLTTPIAYISDIPLDVFAEDGTKGNSESDVAGQLGAGNRYLWYEEFTLSWAYLGSPSLDTLDMDDLESVQCRNMNYQWAIGSRGPMRYSFVRLHRALVGRKQNYEHRHPMLPPYDATNGTVSDGLIIRTNRGDWDTTWANDPINHDYLP